MSLADVILLLLLLCMVYSFLRYVLGLVWAVLVWVWVLIGWTPAARMRRIVKRVKAQHRAISEVLLSEMQSVSDEAIHDILRR